MKRRLLSLLLAIVLVLGLLPTVAFAAETNTKAGVISITTADELVAFARKVNDGETNLSAVLTKDIDLSKITDWPGIGTESNPFSGSFDGQGHTVTFKDAKWGLFGYVQGASGSLATVQNVRTKGNLFRSAIAHRAGYAQFVGCVNGATITASEGKVGGIVGEPLYGNYMGNKETDLRITNCGNEASVTGLSDVGGILGISEAGTVLECCYNIGNITGKEGVGGLAGYLKGTRGTVAVYYSYNTGRVTGEEWVGGIVGDMFNSVSVNYCFNTGASNYAIAGRRYNSTAKINNSYYLGTASDKCSPDYTTTKHYSDNTYEIQTRATAKSAQEMASAEFAVLLGANFQQSCPYPVFTWQIPSDHTGAVCDKCNLGSNVKEQYAVTVQTHDGFTVNGPETATQGESYSFTITITPGYELISGGVFKVNGEQIDKASDGTYTVLNVKGPLSITVWGLQVIEGKYSITLPEEGSGYRVHGEKTVERDQDYTFTLSFVEGFKEGSKFKVIAEEVLTQDQIDQNVKPEQRELTVQNGVYKITQVQKNYRILVSGVEAVSNKTATVNFTITRDFYEFYTPEETGSPLLNMELEVPYFDISLYGMEHAYYNPYCYKDENGTPRSRYVQGNAEIAYNNITALHAFIVATEMYYLGYGKDEVGKGLSMDKWVTVTMDNGTTKTMTQFEAAVSWSGGVGSIFMNLWDHGTNLNYYVNYEYPLGFPTLGSTMDQILIEDGTIISAHMITGLGSGSHFGIFTVGDYKNNGKYDKFQETVDTVTVKQGEKVKLTLYWATQKGNYDTAYIKKADKALYWVYEDDGVETDIRNWNREDLGKNELADLVTDANGQVTINTAGLEPGVYYLAAEGGFTEGGEPDPTGFVPVGYEAGASFFKLVVEEYDGKLADVDGDTEITGLDAALIMQYVAKLVTDVNPGIADVDGDGDVTGLDAALIMQYVAKLIDSFPAENAG